MQFPYRFCRGIAKTVALSYCYSTILEAPYYAILQAQIFAIGPIYMSTVHF